MAVSTHLFCLFVIVMIFELTENRPLNMLDLTYTYDEKTPTFGQHVAFQRKNPRTEAFNSIEYQTAELLSSEHAGTHMDAPYHFDKQALTIDQIPLEYFEGPGVVINISSRADLVKSPLEKVTLQDVKDWEKEHGRIPEGAMVIMNSGWGKYAHNKSAYAVLEPEKSIITCPSFGGEACKFLIESRGVRFIAVDTVTVDSGPSFDCHEMMAKVNGVLVENMANVDLLPLTGSYIKAYPMKIGGGTGAPTRIIATIANPYATTQSS